MAGKIKEELSEHDTAGQDITISGKHFRFELNRSEFENLLKEMLRTAEDLLLDTLESANLQPSDLQRVIMTGGSSRIPAFQRMLAGTSGKNPFISRYPDEDVVRGAAILAAKFTE